MYLRSPKNETSPSYMPFSLIEQKHVPLEAAAKFEEALFQS